MYRIRTVLALTLIALCGCRPGLSDALVRGTNAMHRANVEQQSDTERRRQRRDCTLDCRKIAEQVYCDERCR